ncbi:aldo/keto reductase [Auraticoccus monumenti]|uniref:Predicted oxidoreductase n=1 Tax=Auraticoccus monumenti TaxID=675864 RepID=A0A1G6W6J5_9ACTN|nr:aldo/keto reductase [Auraticoccus monumenti]SDD61418.1 Predicted oxidoreductase [Auraticoccus monumenti]
MTQFRWGIIGPGSIARRFAEHLGHSSSAQLVAVASRTPERAQAFAADFSTEDAPVEAAGSYEELLAREDVDAVYIATVHTEHVRLALASIEAGKHVICEKPLSVDHAGTMVVVEAARRQGVYLAEGYMYRFHPQTAALVEQLRSGVIGDIQHVEASFSFAADVPAGHRLADPALAGGGILDVGGYPVSMARLVAGVAAGTTVAEPISMTASGSLGDTGVDRWAVASLVFASGVTAQIRCGTGLSDENRVVVHGSRGRLSVPSPWLPDNAEGSVLELAVVDRAPETITVPPAFSHALQAEAVARDVAAGQSPEMSWADSLGNAAVLDRWRAAVGVVYPFEQPTADVPPASGRPLTVRPGATMRHGTVPGLDKPVSRLVMGVDNQRTLSHASAMFDDFTERGGNAFDTAWLYGGGLQEKLFGQWVRNRGLRDDVVIIGKGAHTPHCDPASIGRQLEESLERLQTDHVDLYLMHRDDTSVPVGEFVDAMDEQVRLGRVRAYGGSNWTIARTEQANAYADEHSRQRFAVLSDHFGLARALDVPWTGCEHVTDPQDREWLERTGTPLLPWSSQARGFFARADREDTSDAELVRCYYSEDNFERLARAKQLAGELGVAPTAVALAYVLAQSFPTFPLIGPRTIEETRTSLAGLDVELSEEQVRWLDLRV